MPEVDQRYSIYDGHTHDVCFICKRSRTFLLLLICFPNNAENCERQHVTIRKAKKCPRSVTKVPKVWNVVCKLHNIEEM